MSLGSANSSILESTQKLHMTVFSIPPNKIKERLSEAEMLVRLSMSSGTVGPEVIESVLKCLKSNSLNTFSFTSIRTSSELWKKLLLDLSVHPTLERIYLDDCKIPNEAKSALISLITNNKILRMLDIKEHKFTIEEDDKLLNAIKSSVGLTQIEGIDLPEELKTHLEQNIKFQDLEYYVNFYSNKEAGNIENLEQRFKLINAKTVDIQKNFHNEQRLKYLVEKFNLNQAKMYNLLGDDESAIKYYNTVCNSGIKDLQLLFRAHLELGELFYNLKKNSEKEKKDHLCLVSFALFNKAIKYSENKEDKEYTQKWMDDCGEEYIKLSKNNENNDKNVEEITKRISGINI